MTTTQRAAMNLIAAAGENGLPILKPGTRSQSIHRTAAWRLQGHLHGGLRGTAYIRSCEENGVYLWRLTDEGRAILG